MTTRTALLVDDNALLARYTRAFIVSRLPDLHVVLAHDGKAARAEFDRVAPCVVILDVRLPDANGIDLLRELASKDERVAFALISAEEIPPALERELRQTGLVGCLNKPYGAEEMVGLVRRALQRKTRAGEPEERRPPAPANSLIAVDANEMKGALASILAGLFEVRASLSADSSEQAVREVVERHLGPLIATASRLSRAVARKGSAHDRRR